MWKWNNWSAQKATQQYKCQRPDKGGVGGKAISGKRLHHGGKI